MSSRVLLSRVTLDPNRVPSPGARWHLRPARESGCARGAGEAPSSSVSSLAARFCCSCQGPARVHVSGLWAEEKTFTQVLQREKQLKLQEGLDPIRPMTKSTWSVLLLFLSSSVHTLQLCQIKETHKGERGARVCLCTRTAHAHTQTHAHL